MSYVRSSQIPVWAPRGVDVATSGTSGKSCPVTQGFRGIPRKGTWFRASNRNSPRESGIMRRKRQTYWSWFTDVTSGTLRVSRGGCHLPTIAERNQLVQRTRWSPQSSAPGNLRTCSFFLENTGVLAHSIDRRRLFALGWWCWPLALAVRVHDRHGSVVLESCDSVPASSSPCHGDNYALRFSGSGGDRGVSAARVQACRRGFFELRCDGLAKILRKRRLSAKTRQKRKPLSHAAG